MTGATVKRTACGCQKPNTRRYTTGIDGARWFLEKVEIGNFASKIFAAEVDPEILPEDTGAVIDELAAQRVDAFLTAKGIGALERLRLRGALTAKEAAALREE
jgi:hypothetical protein